MPRVKAGVAELEADVLADVEAAAASNKEGLIPPLPPSFSGAFEHLSSCYHAPSPRRAVPGGSTRRSRRTAVTNETKLTKHSFFAFASPPADCSRVLYARVHSAPRWCPPT